MKQNMIACENVKSVQYMDGFLKQLFTQFTFSQQIVFCFIRIYMYTVVSLLWKI